MSQTCDMALKKYFQKIHFFKKVFNECLYVKIMNLQSYKIHNLGKTKNIWPQLKKLVFISRVLGIFFTLMQPSLFVIKIYIYIYISWESQDFLSL